MRKGRVVLLLGSIAVLLALLYYWLGTPRLVSVSPEEGAAGVRPDTPLRLTFSRPMRPDSVASRLSIEPDLPGSSQWEGNTLVFTPDQPWPSGSPVTVRLASGAGSSGLISLPLRQAESWSFTVGRARLAYLFPADGPADIYLYDFDQEDSLRLTSVAGGVLEFAAQADGRAYFFSVNAPAGQGKIFRIAPPETAAGSRETPQPAEPQVVVDCDKAICRNPQVSPAADFLAYERTALSGTGLPTFPQVWIQPLSPDGKATAEAFLAGGRTDQTLQPSWSPKGLLSYYDSHAESFILLDPKTGERKSFRNTTGEPGAWSADGSSFIAPEIIFTPVAESALRDSAAPASSQLIAFHYATGKTQNLTNADNLEDASPAFAPQGGLLAFARKYIDPTRWTPGRQLWLMRSDGSQAHPLTNDPYYNHYDFAWSPDGAQLAFVRFNQTLLTEPPQIWLIDPASTRAQRLLTGGYSPQWIP